MQIVGYIGILPMQELEEDLIVMKVEKEDNFFSKNATMFDTSQGIVEYLRTNRMNKKEMHMYVSYAITLDTQ